MIQSFFIILKSSGSNTARVQVYKSAGLLVFQVCIQHTHKSTSQQVYWSSGLHPAHSQVCKPAGLLVFRFASSTLTSLQASRSTGLQVCIQHTHKSTSQQVYWSPGLHPAHSQVCKPAGLPGEQAWHSSESAHPPPPPPRQCLLGSIPARSHMWV